VRIDYYGREAGALEAVEMRDGPTELR